MWQLYLCISHSAFKSEKLLFIASHESWQLGKNQVALYLSQKFTLGCSSLHRDASGSWQILSPLTCKGCTSAPLGATFVSANELFSIPVPLFLAVLPVPSWDCQHYYNLWSCTAIGLKQFPCTFIQAETQARGPKVAGSCITPNPVTTELKCFHYSCKPLGERRHDKRGSAYSVLNRGWL